MSYCHPDNELQFAQGYYHISEDGIVTLEDNIPEEIRNRFWQTWPSFYKKVIDLQKQGILTSEYPVLPFEDPEENKKRYLAQP